MRVFRHAHGDRIVLLLGGYDKGEQPSARHPQAQIELASTRLKDWAPALTGVFAKPAMVAVASWSSVSGRQPIVDAVPQCCGTWHAAASRIYTGAHVTSPYESFGAGGTLLSLSRERSDEIAASFEALRKRPVDPDRAGAYRSSSNTRPSARDGNWREVHHGNLVCGARGKVPFSSEPLPACDAERRMVVAYQFSGLVTSPGDTFEAPPRDILQFFGGIFEAFRGFVGLLGQFAGFLWSQFVQAIVGDGDPSRPTEAWESLDQLKDRKDHIILQSPKQNPRIPTDILPTENIVSVDYLVPTRPSETGLGIWIEDSSGCMHQLIDPDRSISACLNRRRGDGQLRGWWVPPDSQRLHFMWLSRDHSVNDGDCYGSIVVADWYP